LKFKILDKNYLILLISYGFTAILIFGYNIILARHLGPYEFGIFSSCLVIVMFLSTYIRGVDEFIKNIFGLEKNNPYRWASSLVNLIFLITSLNITFLIFWALFAPHEIITQKVLIILIFFMVGNVLIELIKLILQIQNSFIILSLFHIYPNLLKFLFLISILFFFNHLSIFDIAIFFSLINLSAIIISYKTLLSFLSKGRKNFINKKKEKKPKLIELINKSRNFIKSTFFFILYAALDIFLLKYITGGLALGYFAAANVIIMGSYLFIDAYMKIYSIRYYRYSKYNFDKFKKSYKFGQLFLLLISILITLTLIIFSKFFINKIYGIEYQNSVIILIVLSLSIPFRFLFTNYIMALRTHKFAYFEAKIFRNILFIKIPLSTYLIYSYEAFGAALSVLICELIILLFSYHFTNKVVFKGK
jgi:O-antigen/teichoic acid export membrane protein